MKTLVACLVGVGVTMTPFAVHSQEVTAPGYPIFQTATGVCAEDAGHYSMGDQKIGLIIEKYKNDSSIKFVFRRPAGFVGDGAAIGTIIIGEYKIPALFDKFVTQDSVIFSYTAVNSDFFDVLQRVGKIGMEVRKPNQREAMFVSSVPTFTIDNVVIKPAMVKLLNCAREIDNMRAINWCIQNMDAKAGQCDDDTAYDWRTMATDGKRATFVDKKSIKRERNLVSAWLYMPSFVISNPNHYIILHVSIDCAASHPIILSSSSWTYSHEMYAAQGFAGERNYPKGSLLAQLGTDLCTGKFGTLTVNPLSYTRNYRIQILKLHSDGEPIGPYDSVDYED